MFPCAGELRWLACAILDSIIIVKRLADSVSAVLCCGSVVHQPTMQQRRPHRLQLLRFSRCRTQATINFCTTSHVRIKTFQRSACVCTSNRGIIINCMHNARAKPRARVTPTKCTHTLGLSRRHCCDVWFCGCCWVLAFYSCTPKRKTSR